MKSNRAYQYPALLMACAAGMLTFFSLYLTLELRWLGPFRDLWEFVPFIQQQLSGHWDVKYLLDPYGGAHRILLPKLLFYADWRWFAGSNRLTTATALICQGLYIWMFARSNAADRQLTPSDRLLLNSLMLCALFSTSQVTNFLYAMDVQWFMSNVLGLSALFLLTQRDTTPAQLALVLLLAAAAALCNFTGLVTLPVICLWLLCRQAASRSGKTIVIAIAATICLLHLHHDKQQQQFILDALSRGGSLTDKLIFIATSGIQILVYMAKYLSSPFSRDWPLLGSLLSALWSGLMIRSWFTFRRDNSSLSAWQQLCLAVVTLIWISAAATAFGRIIYPNSATTERYQTLVLPLLPAMLGLMWPWLKSRAGLWLPGITVIFYGLYLLPTQWDSAQRLAALSNAVNQAHTAARAGALSLPYPAATLSYPLLQQQINMVERSDPFLRSAQLGYFRTLPDFQLDRPISNQQIAGVTACTGRLQTLESDSKHGIFTVIGQIGLSAQAITEVVFIQHDRVIGFGARERNEHWLLPLPWQRDADSHFRGYARQDRLDTAAALSLIGFIRNSDVPACQLTIQQIGSNMAPAAQSSP